MEFRSTNDIGYVHFQGDVVSNVSSGGVQNSSHGVQLTGGSTGGIVTASGDEANIALRVGGKGTGQLILSTATGITNIASTQVLVGSRSTSFLAYIQRYRVDWTMPALSSAGVNAAAADSTVTVTGATTNAMYILQQTQVYNSTSDPAIFAIARCSTANELRITSINLGASSLSGSTVSANLLQFGW